MEGDSRKSLDLIAFCVDSPTNNLLSEEKPDEINSSNRIASNDSIKMEYLSFSDYRDPMKPNLAVNVKHEEANLYTNDVINSIKTPKNSLIANSHSKSTDQSTPSRKRQTFKCPFCPKIFCNSSAIAKHKLTHSDERKYVCDICSKAFKRQDHLNGHKHTHKVNKPHACHFCDRSYSDARSLKRHYENQHQKEYKEKISVRNSGSDDNGSLALNVFEYFEDHKSVKCDVCDRGFKNQAALNGHMRLHGGYGQTKNCITGPGEPKVNTTINSTEKTMESLISFATDKQSDSLNRVHSNIILVKSKLENNFDRPVQSIKTSIPSATVKFAKQCDTSSVIVLNSDHFTKSPAYNQSLSPESQIVLDSNNLQSVSIEDLCLVLPPNSMHDHMHDPCNISSTSEKSSSPIEMNTDVVSYSQSTTKQSSTNTDLSQNQYSPITPAYTNKNGNVNMNLNEQNVFTYPTVLNNQDISNQSFNESNLSFEPSHTDDFLLNFNKYPTVYGTSNPNSVVKSWQYFDLPINPEETPEYNNNSNPPSIKKIPSSNNIQDLLMNFDNLSDSNEITLNSEPSTVEDNMWYSYHDDTANVDLSNTFMKIVKKEEETILTNLEPVESQLPILNPETVNESDLNPIISEAQPHKKNKVRPGPIFIPPQTSAHISRLRSPRVWSTPESNEQKIPPYTPPPMLSPQRKGSGLFNTVWNSSIKNSANSFSGWSTPLSTKPVTVVSNNCCSDPTVSSIGDQHISAVLVQDYSNEKSFRKTFERTIEPEHFIYQDECIDGKIQYLEEKDGLPTSATPRINIGPEYQVDVTKFRPSKRPCFNDRVYDTLVWNPRHFKETGENISSLNLLMKIASSPAVKSCGLNMEYTFHLLFKFQGDLEKTLQALLEESFVVYDYVYAETSNWTTEEIGKFQERLKVNDRDFMRVSLDLQSYGMNKSVKACVEFYYVWKHMNNITYVNTYRLKPRKKLATRNNTPQHEDDNYPPLIDSYSSGKHSGATPYNLRKYTSENQKVTKSYYYQGSKTSSCNSSREPSPVYPKSQKSVNILSHEIAKKSRSYQCPQCNKIFAKQKTFDNHNRTCGTKLSKSKAQTSNIERSSESARY